MDDNSHYDDVCFFIAPIGEEGSDVRHRSDLVHDFIVKEAVAALGLRTVRADAVERPGQINLNVFEHVVHAKAAVADLTGRNPNVFYELAIRHAAQLPVVLIAERDEIPRLPFDINQMRVIPIDHRDLASVDDAKKAIRAHLTHAFEGAVDSPISTLFNLEALAHGAPAEQALATLATQIESLGGMVGDLHRGMIVSERSGQQSAALDVVRAGLIAQLSVEAERRGFTVSFADSPLRGPHVILTVPVPDRAPGNFTVPFARLTEERVRNLFRSAERAANPEAFAPSTTPPEGWTHELQILPREDHGVSADGA
jgi:hypothetical protein